jgi:hypothetical protein
MKNKDAYMIRALWPHKTQQKDRRKVHHAERKLEILEGVRSDLGVRWTQVQKADFDNCRCCSVKVKATMISNKLTQDETEHEPHNGL